jgi:hypothetical protein
LSDAKAARILAQFGELVSWDNPNPQPQEYIESVAEAVADALSFTFKTRRR